MLHHLSQAAKEECVAYARELGLHQPLSVTTVKPSGTICKLFGLTEGVHLPARVASRWVQFKGTREPGTDRRIRSASRPILGYEYLPEETISPETFATIAAAIGAADRTEAVDMLQLQCANGACPV